jgi:superfamily II DNA/RNA helicase
VPFRDLGVDEVICAALDDAGIRTTFPIQALTLPLAITGQDIIGQARTGTGKTLAFGVPILHRLATTLAAARADKQPAALIVVPTRELAIQVADDLKKAGARLGARVLTVYGGRAYEPQIEALTAGVDVVVGTPGRLLDLANRRNLDLGQIRALVLDEADKMLDLGFLPDVERLLRLTPDDRQTMLFSATMPGDVVTLARRHMRRATNIRAEEPDELAPPPLTTQHVFRTHQMDKIEVLARLCRPRTAVSPWSSARRSGPSTRCRPRSPTAASPPRPCTVTWASRSASVPCGPSAPARSTCSSPPRWPPAGSTSTA